jgi:hypothetical protein
VVHGRAGGRPRQPAARRLGPLARGLQGEPDADWGNVEVAGYDLRTGRWARTILYRRFEQDDHNNPSFLPLEGRGVAGDVHQASARSEHLRPALRAGRPAEWSEPDVFRLAEVAMAGVHSATYSNLFRLPSGRIVNFYRGYRAGPELTCLGRRGRTLDATAGGSCRAEDGYSPYLKYAQDSAGRPLRGDRGSPAELRQQPVPRGARGRQLRRSDGRWSHAERRTRRPSRAHVGLHAGVPGRPRQRRVDDGHRGRRGRPAGDRVQRAEGRPRRARGQGGDDMRYGYARWDGARWHPRDRVRRRAAVPRRGRLFRAGDARPAGHARRLHLDQRRPGATGIR